MERATRQWGVASIRKLARVVKSKIQFRSDQRSPAKAAVGGVRETLPGFGSRKQADTERNFMATPNSRIFRLGGPVGDTGDGNGCVS